MLLPSEVVKVSFFLGYSCYWTVSIAQDCCQAKLQVVVGKVSSADQVWRQMLKDQGIRVRDRDDCGDKINLEGILSQLRAPFSRWPLAWKDN